MVAAQLPLPGVPRNRDPEAWLDRIQRDKLDMKHEIRVVLDRYADSHGVQASQVERWMNAYRQACASAPFDDRSAKSLLISVCSEQSIDVHQELPWLDGRLISINARASQCLCLATS